MNFLTGIFKVFNSDDLLNQALLDCYKMLDLTKKMFNESIDNLRYDKSSKIDIYLMDKEINEFERVVRRKIMTHLSVNSETNLSAGLVLVSVVIDIERIGDYTKNICDLAVNHKGKLLFGTEEKKLSIIENNVKDYFNNTIDAFKNQDIDLARKLMEEYKSDISIESSKLVNSIISGEIKDLSSVQAGSLCLYLRYLKRISGHSKNLVSSIVNPFERIGYSE